MICSCCEKKIRKCEYNIPIKCNHCERTMHFNCYGNRLIHSCLDERRSVIKFFLEGENSEKSHQEQTNLIREATKTFTFDELKNGKITINNPKAHEG